MRVLVTGGTGFVGAHTVKSLLERGHEVRLFVRSPDRVVPALAPLGYGDIDDIVTGDVTDQGAVERAMEGCDAVVHAASVYSLDVRRAKEIAQTNVQGTRLVLETALAAGLDPVVHVSSYVSLVPVQSPVVSATSTVGTGVGPYSTSKAESERVARELQERGEPVVSVLPGSVWGPHDPHFGESHQIATNFLKGMMRFVPRSGRVPVVDVRDVGEVIAATIEPGKGARSYLAGGHLLSTPEMGALLCRVTGRNIRMFAIPTSAATAGGPMYSAFQAISPWRLPLSREVVRVAAQEIQEVDDANVRDELGVTFRQSEETFRDTVLSLLEDGRIKRKEAGGLGEALPVA